MSSSENACLVLVGVSWLWGDRGIIADHSEFAASAAASGMHGKFVLLGTSSAAWDGTFSTVGSIIVAAITGVVIYSALRSRRIFGRVGSLVVAICGGMLAVMGLFGPASRSSGAASEHLTNPPNGSLIDAIAIPWAALGLAVTATSVCALVLRIAQTPVLARVCRCIRARIVSLRRPISRKSDVGKRKVSKKVQRRSDDRIGKHDPFRKRTDPAAVDKAQ